MPTVSRADPLHYRCRQSGRWHPAFPRSRRCSVCAGPTADPPRAARAPPAPRRRPPISPHTAERAPPRIRRGPRPLAAPRTPPHVSRETSSRSRGPERGGTTTNYIDVTPLSAKQNNDAARRLHALALTVHTVDGRHGVVHDLALELRHRRDLFPLPGLQHAARHLVAQCSQLLAAPPPPAADIEHQPTALTGLLMDGQPRQFLERVEHLPLASDQLGQVIPAVDAYHRAVALDVEIDVPVEVQQIQQLFEVVAGDLAFDHQPILQVTLGRRRRSLRAVLLVRQLVAAFGSFGVRHLCLSLNPPDTVPVQRFRLFGRAPGRGVVPGRGPGSPAALPSVALPALDPASPSVAL